MKVWEWVSTLRSHDIYDADGLGKDITRATGKAPCWSGATHKEMKKAIVARGLGGNLAPDNGHRLIAGYEIAEILAENLLNSSPGAHLSGRGSRFRAALEALKTADI